MRSLSPIFLLLTFFTSASLLAQVANAGPDTSLCVNFYTMQGSALPAGATGNWVLYTGCGVFTQPTSPTNLVTDLCLGENLAGWVVNDNGTFTSDFVAITVYDPDMPFANAGMDQTIVGPQTSAQLSGSPTPIWPATCSWTILTGSSIIADPSDPNAVASGLGVGENIFVWTCENGPCWSAPTEDTVVVQMMQLPTSIGVEADHRPLAMWFDQAFGVLNFVGDVKANSLSIVNALGQRVEMSSRSSTGSLDLSGLPSGFYCATATISGTRRAYRFVVGR